MEAILPLVQKLSHGTMRERTATATELANLLSTDSIRAIDLIRADCVPPLLLAAQTPKRTAGQLAPDPSTPAPVIAFADAALMLLGDLCEAGINTLKEAGWHVDDDGTGRGKPIYINPKTGESQNTPPDLGVSIFGDQLDPKDYWALTLLFELNTITSPYANPLDGTLCWPARIRFHEPETNQYTPTTEKFPLSYKLAMTVVDVAQDDEDDVDEDHEGNDTTIAFTRHLVLGPWHGIPSFRETEVDLDHPPPGSHLESWYTCAMVCASFLGTRKPGRGKCLLVGLGGGAMASFIGRYWPGMSVEAVEIDPRVVKVAERWFGVKCEPSILSPEDGVLGDGDDEPQHFKMDENSRPAVVRVTNAENFVIGAIKDLECRYDVILLDVYTRGEFPAALVNVQFFESLVKLLKTKENHGWDGALIINAGIGKDKIKVEELTRKVMPVTKTLLDSSASSRMDDDNENAVVIGMKSDFDGNVSLEISLSEWKKRAALVKEAWPEAPIPPFELEKVIYAPNNEILVSWGVNSMIPEEGDRSEDHATETLQERKEVKFMSKDDEAFSIFD